MNQLVEELYSKLDNQEKIIRALQQRVNKLEQEREENDNMESKPKFYAMVYEWNEHKIKYTNIIREDILQALEKMIKKGAKKDELKERLESLLKYHYWSKSEYEIMVGDLFCKEDELEKIDVWFQIEPNINLILDNIIMYLAPRKGKKIVEEDTDETSKNVYKEILERMDRE